MIFYQGRIQNDSNAAASFLRQAAARAVILPLIPIQHDQIILAFLFKSRNPLIQPICEPGICHDQFAVVGIVAHIRGDENKVKESTSFHILVKHAEGNNTILAAFLVESNSVKVDSY